MTFTAGVAHRIRSTRRMMRPRTVISVAALLLVSACTPAAGGGTDTTTTTMPGTTTTTSATSSTSTSTSTSTTSTTLPTTGSAYLYVADTNLGVIKKIDTATLNTVATLSVGGTIGSSISLVGNRIFYSTADNSATIGAYDLTTGANNRNALSTSAIYSSLLFKTSPALPGKLFLAEQGISPGTIREYDVNANPPVKIQETTFNTIGSNVQDYEISSDGTRIWVAAGAPYEITEVRTSDLQPSGKKFPTGPYPAAVASNTATGSELLAVGRAALTPSAYVFDAANPAVVSSWDVGTGVEDRGIGFSRDGSRVFAVSQNLNQNKSELVTVVGSTGAVTRAPFLTGTGLSDLTTGELAVDPGTGRIFVSGVDSIAVYNPDGTYGTTLTEAGPRGLAMSATGPTTVPPVLTTTTTTTTTSTTTTAPTTTTTINPNTGPPVIASFAASTTSGPSPLTTGLQWSISDPDNDPLTCRLDLDNDAVYEVVIPNCTSNTTRSVTVNAVGTRPIRLKVTDYGLVAALATVTLNVTAPSADEFAINVRFNGTFTASQQAAFTTAAARWSQVVKTGLPDVSVNVAAGACGAGEPAFNGTVDDLTIDATIGTIDGAGSILAKAGPCITRTTGGLPAYGVMLFDTLDVANLESTGQLSTVVLHEMGHVLGFGTLWASPLLTGAGTSNPLFTGVAARGAYSALGGTGINVPVENLGGPGTADGHWREAVFGNELMTGYLNTAANPLSTVTIGSLADIGYGVDLAAADPFTAGLGAPAAPGASTQIVSALVHPINSV